MRPCFRKALTPKTVLRSISLLLLLALKTYANPGIRFEHLSIDDGLSQNSVYSILQDSKGFMWFGTLDGLNKFDGYNFTVFKHNGSDSASIANNYIYTIFEDDSGYIWAGTRGGLSRFDPATERFKNYRHDPKDPHSLSNNLVLAITEFSDEGKSELWIGTYGGGLNRFDPETEKFSHYRHDPNEKSSLKSNFVRSLHISEYSGEEILWVGTAGGLDNTKLGAEHTQNRKFTHFLHDPNDPKTISSNNIWEIYEDSRKRLWLATLGGGANRLTFAHDLSPHASTPTPESAEVARFSTSTSRATLSAGEIIQTITEDRSGNIWFGGKEGLYKISGEANDLAQVVHMRYSPFQLGGLSGGDVTSVYEDEFGTLWVGTSEGGINKYSKESQRFRRFSHNPFDANSLGRNMVLSFGETVQNGGRALWVGTENGGLYEFIESENRFVSYVPQGRFSDAFERKTINALLGTTADKTSTLWVGAADGLFRIQSTQEDERLQFLVVVPGSENRSIRVICEDPFDPGGAVWVGTESAGLHKLDSRSGASLESYFSEDLSVPSKRIFAMHPDKRSGEEGFWIGAFDGLYKVDIKTGAFSRFLANGDSVSLSSNVIYSISVDDSGTLWVGTDRGLNKSTDGGKTFKQFFVRDGLPNNVIYGVQADDNGFLWLSTNKGIAKYDPKSKAFERYDVFDGLQSNEFNFGASFKSGNGDLYFGGIRGFNVFSPNDIVAENPHPPKVVLTSFTIMNDVISPGKTYKDRMLLEKSISETEEITLSHADLSVEFEFTALHYVNPRQNVYAYKMEGFEDQWHNAGQRRMAQYTNLPPGNFTFRVRAANSDGVWNNDGAALKIHVTPPFWKTTWFLFAAVLTGVLIVYSFIRYRTGLLRIRTRELQDMVRLRTTEISKANSDLQNEVLRRRQIEEALIRAKESAEAADHAKSEFLANMSHEIRTPLNGVIGMNTLLLDAGLDKTQRGYAQVIQTSAKSLQRVISDILDFSKIEAGKLKLENINFQPKTAIRDVHQILSFQAEGKNVDFSAQVDPQIPETVYGDPERLKQILLNLTQNSIKFTQEGAVRLRADLEKITDTEALIRFSVSDTGVGIPQDRLDDLFQPFAQLDTSTTRKFGGTGLGLSIVRQLVDLMGGGIEAESEEGKGSRFRVTIPFATHRDEFKENGSDLLRGEGFAPRTGDASHSATHLLLVEDDVTNQAVASLILQKLGYQVNIASNGKEALEFLKNESCDLVLMDVQMPEMDGFETTQIIRDPNSEVKNHEIPIIAMTAHSMEGDQLRCLAVGMNDYVSKPFEPEVLHQTIQKYAKAEA